jgi:hypothetical protein
MTAQDWVDLEYYVSPNTYSATFQVNGNSGGSMPAVPTGNSNPYRCVTGPSN